MMSRPLYPIRKLQWVLYALRLNRFGSRSRIWAPLRIDGAKNISIGTDVTVGYKTWLAARPVARSAGGISQSELVIGDGTYIGHFNHIFAARRVFIGRKVLTGNGVYIADNMHEYADVEVPIIDQPVRQKGDVEIGDGTWLGENACVLGVRIGRNCVIGANAVVTKDIPDFCVAVGAPARVIKQFSSSEGKWLAAAKDGDATRR